MSGTSDLDTRLRSASDSLRRTVAPLDPGTAPSGATGPDRRPLLAAAAAVLLVVALAAVALALRDDSDSVTTDPEVVPRLVLDEAVVGLPATGAVDLPLASDEGGLGTAADVALFDAPAPTRAGGSMDVLLLTLPAAEDGATMELADGEPVTVRGASGRITDEPQFGLSVAWQDADGRAFVLATRDSDARAELLAMADAGTMSSDGFTPGPTGAGVDPPGRRAKVDDVDIWTGMPLSASAVGHMVGYQADDDSQRLVWLTTFAGSDAEAEVVRWMAGAQEPVDVRGHDGWTGEDVYESGAAGSGSSDGSTHEETTISTIRTLVWEEAPGVYVVLRGSGEGDGIGEAEMQRLADSLRPASDAEWEALGDEADSASPPEALATIDGEFDGGTWAVYLDEDGSVCGGTQTESSGSSVCGLAPGGADVLTDDEGTPLVVYGALPPGAADVQVPGATPGTSTSTSQAADGATTLYAITVDGGPLPTEVVFVDAAGQEVARIAVGFAPATETTVP